MNDPAEKLEAADTVYSLTFPGFMEFRVERSQINSEDGAKITDHFPDSRAFSTSTNPAVG